MSVATTSLSSVLSTTSTGTGTGTGTAVMPTHTTCALSHEIPTQDAACAAVHSDISDKIMKQCCGEADVVSIDGGCASYCLAQGKDIGELSRCLYSNGFTGNSVYCNQNLTATATGAVSTATGTAASTTGTTASTSGTGTATGTGATASSTTGAAVPAAKVSAGGVGVLALLFCSALFGTIA